MVYDLPLLEEKIKPHQITTLHLVSALAFITAGAIIVVYNYTIPLWGGVLLAEGLFLLFLTIFKNKWVVSNKINTRLRVGELVIAFIVAVYSAIQHWKFPLLIFGALSAAIIFAIYWERTSGEVLVVHIDKDGLRLPVTSRKRLIPWAEIENVVLRYGTLTVDCADNSLFQWNLANPELDNEILEAFCSTQVEDHRGKRIKDW